MSVPNAKHHRGRAGFLIAAAAALALAGACASDTVRQGRGSSYLILDVLEGAAGGEQSSTFTTVLRSDVITNGGIFEDNGRATLRLALKDVGTPSNPNEPTSNNYITITRYRVVFRRSDGRNQPGVDVPYGFDGAVTATVRETPVSVVFSLVRAQAKLEPPLIALRGLGGAIAISTLADVTFYGRDQTGNEVAVTGTISVNFADWADPD